MPTEYGWVRNSLIRLRDRADTGWRNSEDALGKYLLGMPFLFRREKLEKLVPVSGSRVVQIPPVAGDELHRPNEGLMLPPLPRNQRFVPILCVAWDFEKSGGQRGKFRLFLLPGADFDERSRHGVPEKLKAFGLHYDDWEVDRNWCFGHTQISDAVSPYPELFEPLPAWVPARVPRIPLAVSTPSAGTILFCLLASLYGLQSIEIALVSSAMPHNVLGIRSNLGRGP